MVSSATIETQSIETEIDDTTRRIIAYITWFVILFIPTYSSTVTDLYIYGPITEESYLWPWMILTRYSPREIYRGDQYAVVGFPWSIILFIPFLYAMRSAWMLYSTEDDKMIHSAQIVLAAIAQYFLLFMTYKSQANDVNVTEEVTVYFFPQIILIAIHGILSVKWYFESMNEVSNK